MTIPEVQQARDYNRGLPAPIRWAHVGITIIAWTTRPVRTWTANPRRRAWAAPLVWGLALAAVVGVFDGAVLRSLRGTALWRPDLITALTYAVAAVSVLIASLMWMLDRGKRRRVLDWLAGLIVALVVCRIVSMVVGRPRPRFDDPGYFINPLGSYPIGPGQGIRHAWEWWGGGVWQLWSMPAVQAGYAAVGASIVAATYPKFRAFAWIAAFLAVAAVVLTGDGYASDAVVGATAGLAAGRLAIERKWGKFGGKKILGELGDPN